MANLHDVLKEWVDQRVTVVNPQSFAETVVRDVIRMETYQAMVTEVGEDFVRIHFQASKRNVESEVDQVIPFHEIKRISVWAEERLLHL